MLLGIFGTMMGLLMGTCRDLLKYKDLDVILQSLRPTKISMTKRQLALLNPTISMTMLTGKGQAIGGDVGTVNRKSARSSGHDCSSAREWGQAGRVTADQLELLSATALFRSVCCLPAMVSISLRTSFDILYDD